MIPSRAFAALTSGLCVASVPATTIVPTFQNRFISVAGQGMISAPNFDVFDASLPGGANQHSFIDPLLIHGNGGAFVGDPPASRHTQSPCAISFTLDAAVEYRFQGEIHGVASTARAFSTARLSGPDGIVHEFLAGPQPGPWDRTFDVSGMLPAGDYVILLETDAFNGDPIGSFAVGSYDCDFSIVPEPVSAATLLAGLFYLRRRVS